MVVETVLSNIKEIIVIGYILNIGFILVSFWLVSSYLFSLDMVKRNIFLAQSNRVNVEYQRVVPPRIRMFNLFKFLLPFVSSYFYWKLLSKSKTENIPYAICLVESFKEDIDKYKN